MTKITENCYVNVEGWTQEEVNKGAEIFAEALGCRVGDVEIMEGHYYLFKYMYTMFVGTSLDCNLTLENPIEITKEQVFANVTVEDLPPVGVECEWKYWDLKTWCRVKILAYHGESAWMEYLDDGNQVIIDLAEGSFRQIKTERDKQIEKITKTLDDWFEVDIEMDKHLSEYLYEKGLRITDK